MTLQRLLIWSIPLIVALAAGAWWVGQKTETVSPTVQSPEVVMPPGADLPTERAADIDALWNRYEALSQAASPDPLAETRDPSTATVSPVPPPSEAARQRQAEREAIRQRRRAVMAARDEALTKIRHLEPDDVDGLMDTLQSFNQRMQENGVEERIEIAGLRQQLLGSQRLATVSQAMLDEALKGEDVDPQRLQALSRELREIQNDMTGRVNADTSDGNESP